MAHVDDLKISFYEGHSQGQHIGQQQILDATMIYMARIGWEKEQVIDYYKEMNLILDRYADAFKPCMEQEIWQERMDDELRSVLGDTCIPFSERYPTIRGMGYDKPVKEERHPAAKKKGRKKKR